MNPVALSLLDRANTRREHDGTVVDANQIFAEVTARAQAAERHGYHRFWVAEHHSVSGIAGSAPTLLVPHLASATSTIRVGTGGIMVPSHQPLIIAEQIATLQALYGARVDAGLGASVGFTKPVRAALRQAADAKEHFQDDVDEVISYLDGTAPITAYPQDRSRTELYVLTGGGSAHFAARRGMGLVLGGPAVTNALRGTRNIDGAPQAYRNTFRPAPHRAQEPRIIASIHVAVAVTRQAAEELALSEAWALTRSRSTGVFQPLEDPNNIRAAAATDQERRRLARALATTVYGTPEEVVGQLQNVVDSTGADELLITGNMWDPAAQLESDRLLSQAWASVQTTA